MYVNRPIDERSLYIYIGLDQSLSLKLRNILYGKPMGPTPRDLIDHGHVELEDDWKVYPIFNVPD